MGVPRTKTWPEYPIRVVSRRLGVFFTCVVCSQRIVPGQRYFNGGSSKLRAHVHCGMAAHRAAHPLIEVNPTEVAVLAHAVDGRAT